MMWTTLAQPTMERMKKINLITGKILHLDLLDNKFIRVISNHLLWNKLALILIFMFIGHSPKLKLCTLVHFAFSF